MRVYGFIIIRRKVPKRLETQEDYKEYNAYIIEFSRVLRQTIIDNKICCVEVNDIFYFMSYNLAQVALDFCASKSIDKNDLEIVYEASSRIIGI